MKHLAILPFLLLLTAFATGQNFSIRGTVSDSLSGAGIGNASILLLEVNDSSIAGKSTADELGRFQINHIRAGSYDIVITHSVFHTLKKRLLIHTDGPAMIEVKLLMVPSEKLLEEVVIRPGPIRIKVDTTEYIVDSFVIRQNENVEDFLKRLPGISVDKHGRITSQGKQVLKVLVDGDEFFSNDPAIATKNLRADGIRKVQIFDKKSEQAAFTGIDDGNKIKTINLVLKEEAKRGYFGKLSAAALGEQYNMQTILNSFKANRKLSAFIVGGNAGQTGLSLMDGYNFGFYDGGEVNIVNGQIVFSEGFQADDIAASSFAGQGLPQNLKAGIHFSDKWKNDQIKSGGDYLFNKLAVRNENTSISQHFLPDSLYYEVQSEQFNSSRNQHSANTNTSLIIDSTSEISIKINGSAGSGTIRSQMASQITGGNQELVNESNNSRDSHIANARANGEIVWKKKLAKTGRTVSVTYIHRYFEQKTDIYLLNKADFYEQGNILVKEELIDQRKMDFSRSQISQSTINYTEPISSQSLISFTYTFRNEKSDRKMQTFLTDGQGKYTQRLDSLSNEYVYVPTRHSVGIGYRLDKKKVQFFTQAEVSNTQLLQKNLDTESNYSYQYQNFYPKAEITFKFNSGNHLNVSYKGSTRQPAINELQPLPDNSDPLKIVIGNPGLRPQYTNSFNFNFNSYNAIVNRLIHIGAHYIAVSNEITNKYWIDSVGKTRIQFVNTQGNYRYGLSARLNMKIPGTSLQGTFSPQLLASQIINEINNQPNILRSLTFSPQAGIGLYKEKFDFSVSLAPSYNRILSSLNSSGGTEYWIQNYEADGHLYLPGNVNFGTDISLEKRQKLNDFDVNTQLFLWNGYVEKLFLKNKQLSVRLSVHDILNQNTGYRRIINPNNITESRNLTFRRYGLITGIFNFKTKGRN